MVPFPIFFQHYCLVYGQLKWQKSSFRGSSQIFFLSNFPFVNLQMKSKFESVRPIKSCTESMKTIFDFEKSGSDVVVNGRI